MKPHHAKYISAQYTRQTQVEVKAECLKGDSGDWQGFRLWMTFDRQQAEKLFTRKKPKRRFFGSRVFKKLYSGKAS